MANPLLKTKGKIDPKEVFPHISSFSDLSQDLQQREAIFLETQGKILEASPENKKLFKELEVQTSNEAKKVLTLCQAINQRSWTNVGITEAQHEKAGERAQKIFKDFKSTADELRKTQKEKDKKFNILEFNAALFLAPLAAYGFLKVHLPEAENEALCKNVSIIVAGIEIVYVFHKDTANAWKASVKEISKRKDKKPLSLLHSKEAWADMSAGIKRAAKNISEWAGQKKPVRVVKRIKQRLMKKKDI